MSVFISQSTYCWNCFSLVIPFPLKKWNPVSHLLGEKNTGFGSTSMILDPQHRKKLATIGCRQKHDRNTAPSLRRSSFSKRVKIFDIWRRRGTCSDQVSDKRWRPSSGPMMCFPLVRWDDHSGQFCCLHDLLSWKQPNIFDTDVCLCRNSLKGCYIYLIDLTVYFIVSQTQLAYVIFFSSETPQFQTIVSNSWVNWDRRMTRSPWRRCVPPSLSRRITKSCLFCRCVQQCAMVTSLNTTAATTTTTTTWIRTRYSCQSLWVCLGKPVVDVRYMILRRLHQHYLRDETKKTCFLVKTEALSISYLQNSDVIAKEYQRELRLDAVSSTGPFVCTSHLIISNS